MVRQWQELFYEERYSEVYLSPDLPDYVKWAEAMGCVGMRVDNADDVVADDREGERDRRPSGRDRLPHRLAREGVPDGRRGRLERRHHPRSRVRQGGSDDDVSTARITSSPSPSRTSPVCSRASPVCSRGAAFNIVSLAVSPTDDERFSRMTIVVDAESAPLEQVVKQLNKLIPVIKITEVAPGEGVERELMMRDRAGDAPRRAAQVTELDRDLRGQDRRRRLRGDDDHGRGRAREARRVQRPRASRSASSSSSAPAGSRCPSSPASPSGCASVKTARGLISVVARTVGDAIAATP